jgi:hypothetical protein
MFERLLALHAAGRLTDAALNRAVQRGWISQAQADVIRQNDTQEP